MHDQDRVRWNTMNILTSHRGVDPANIGEKTNLRELEGEGGRFDHFFLEDLGAFTRVVERIDVEIAKRDLGGLSGSLGGEDSFAIGKYMVEEIVLHVLARERLCIITFNWKGFPTEVTNTADR